MLRPKRRQRRQRYTRPAPHWFTLGSLRSFGTRLWHPPPPAKEEHYAWFIAPRYNVQLEDVVADRHLPPLSRHDFEEYLEHVEGNVENLYFHEWVQRYRQLYKDWADSVLPAASLCIPGSSRGLYPSRDLWEQLKDCQDRRLREEFAFARATFFGPEASMRLNIDDQLRDQILLIPNGPPPRGKMQQLTDKLPSFPNQPEPSLFDAILAKVDDALGVAFARFLRLAFCNSGLWHSCVGHIGGACILACGLAMWCMGVISHGLRHIAGSLPLIWMGIWFMLVSANGHCLVVYVTGDARQLYPHEFARPLLPGTTAPPIYSLAPAPNEALPDSTISFSRKSSVGSNLLPFASTPGASIPTPQPAHIPTRRVSHGMLRLFARRADDNAIDLRALDRGDIESQLPPARRTKDLPRSSFAINVEQANIALPPLPLFPPSSECGSEGRPGSPFSEENDFGIVVSEAFEGDGTFPVESSAPICVSVPVSHGHENAPQEPPAPSAQPRTMPDGLEGDSRRGSKSSEVDKEQVVLRWPWPRKMFGPMTLVHSPLVRRAHWVITVRTAIVASVVTCGMAFGLVV